MATMPRRTPEHVTEELSRRAFREVIPAEWVIREPTPDYGIDLSVEIFDQAQTTGMEFKVQLKGTTREDGLVIRLPHETYRYYMSLAVPVLVALHHQRTGRVLGRWESYDPDVDPPSKKTIPIRLGDENQLMLSKSSQLRGEVETYHRLRDPRSGAPIRLALHFESGEVAGVSILTVASTIHDLAAGMPDVVRLAGQFSDDEIGILSISPTQIRVSCRGLSTTTVQYPVPWLDEPNLDLALADAFVAIGLIMQRMGAMENAARLFESFAATSGVATNPGIVPAIGSTLARTHRVAAVIALLETLPPEASDNLLISVSLPWTAQIESFSPAEQAEIVDFLKRRAIGGEGTRDPHESAADHSSLANRLRALRRYTDALEHYDRALELDARYAERAYFHAEVAGAYFESGDYFRSIEAYEESIALGAGHNARLLADAQLFAGAYERARDGLKQVVSQEDCDPVWQLKWQLADRLVSLGLTDQSREPDDALRAADVGQAPSADAAYAALLHALQLDGLCPLAWFNLGRDCRRFG